MNTTMHMNNDYKSGIMALLLFSKNSIPNLPQYLKIPKVLIKKIFDDAVGNQISITVQSENQKYYLKAYSTNTFIEIARLFSKDNLNDIEGIAKDQRVFAPNHTNLGDSKIQDGDNLKIIYRVCRPVSLKRFDSLYHKL